MSSTIEKQFQNSKQNLQYCCCSSKNKNKLQIFSLNEDGYRIYCTKCLKMSDGKTFDNAKNNFLNKKFKF